MTPELRSALRFVEAQSLRNRVLVSHKRDLPSLRRYLVLTLRDHGGKPSAYSVAACIKARHLYAEALAVAEPERMAGL